MEPEQIGAFAESTRRNVKTNIDYSKDTRDMFRELEQKVQRLENNIETLTELVNGFREQLGKVFQKVYQGGTSGG